MIKIYGIKNCDTMKKAIKWLNDNGVEHELHDYKKAGIDQATLEQWISQVGWEVLVNKRGTTWRKLPDSDKDSINEAKATKLMQLHTSMIKRPVLNTGEQLLVGFKAEEYQRCLKP